MTSKKSAAAAPATSPSGYWEVELSAPYPEPAGDITYKPGQRVTVDQALFDAMKAAGVVEHGRPAA